MLCGIGAFVCWGVFPIYWRFLGHVPSTEVVCHRIVWSCVFLFGVAAWTGRKDQSLIGRSIRQHGWIRLLAIYSLAAVLISVNWFTFIWAVNHGRVLEASLGYYINPLFSVLLGVTFLHERLSRAQGFGIAIAACGVMVMAWASGAVPWIALALAASFAFYGMVKKKAPLPALQGLFLETVVLFLPALVYVLIRERSGDGAMVQHGFGTAGMLLLGGFVTVVPLAMFATAAQRIPLSTLGILQYIGPTLQFLFGVYVFNEPLTTGRLFGFSLVWVGSILFMAAMRHRHLASKRGLVKRRETVSVLPELPEVV